MSRGGAKRARKDSIIVNHVRNQRGTLMNADERRFFFVSAWVSVYLSPKMDGDYRTISSTLVRNNASAIGPPMTTSLMIPSRVMKNEEGSERN